MRHIKKLAALTAAAVMASQLTACGRNSTWSSDIDGIRVPAGVYIYYLQNSYYDALNKVKETREDGAEVTAADVFSGNIEDKPAKQWITDEAIRQTRLYAAVENKFNEYGLTLTEQDKSDAQTFCDQMWDYGGDYFSELGISKESYMSIYLNDDKRSQIFEKIYGEGGDHAVSDEEIKQFMLENYVLVNFIDMELKDGEGNLLKSDGKAERMAMAEDYVTRFKNGEDFDALNNEYRTFYTKLKEDAAKETQGSETPAVTEDLGDTQIQWTPVEGSDAEDDAPDTEETGIVAGEETPEETAAPDEELSSDEDTETEAPAETTVTTTAPAETEAPAETAEQPAPESEISNYPSNKQVVEKDGTYPDADVVAKAFELTVGDVAIVESKDGEHYYVVARLDLNEDENYFTSSKQSLLFEMKSDDYDALIDEWVAAQNYKENPAAVNRYDPTKMFKDS